MLFIVTSNIKKSFLSLVKMARKILPRTIAKSGKTAVVRKRENGSNSKGSNNM